MWEGCWAWLWQPCVRHVWPNLEVKKFVKPGGYFIGSTINKSISSFLLAIVAAEYVFNLLPKKTHEWNKFVRPEILKEVLENRGFFEKQ